MYSFFQILLLDEATASIDPETGEASVSFCVGYHLNPHFVLYHRHAMRVQFVDARL